MTEVDAAALRRHRAAQGERIRAGAAWQNGDLVFANIAARTATIQHQAVDALDDLLAVELAVNQDGGGAK